MSDASNRPARGWGTAGLVAAIVAGAVLRLLWPDDIEYKGDEAYSMRYALAQDRSDLFPPIGMPSSAGIPNFGMSAWVFVGLGQLFGVQSPPDLARAVAVCSILALLLYLPFIRRLVPEDEQEAWRWGVALMALSPLALLLHRKIWPPSLFPLMTLAFLAGWMRRGTALGALALGVVGPLLGQVHMSGFFLAAAFAAWALLFDRGSMRWRWWLLGSVLGSLPIVPWLLYVIEHPGCLKAGEGGSLAHPLKGLFLIRWIIQPYGFDTLNNALGSEFWAFLRWPSAAGQPTFLVGGLHALSAVLLLLVGVPGLRRLWRLRGEWAALLVGRSSATAFALAAAFLGFGLLFSLTGRPFRYYYLLVGMPLMFVWAAGLALELDRSPERPLLPPRRILLLLCVAQGLVSLAFLCYVHANQRPMRGDYGTPYGAQPQHLRDRAK